MVHQARQVIVVANSSKIAMISPALICELTDIDILITDSGSTSEALAGFKANEDDERWIRGAKDDAADQAKFKLLFSNAIHLSVSTSQIELAP